MDSAGIGSWTQLIFLGMSAGCQAQTAPLEFAGNHKKTAQKILQKAEKIMHIDREMENVIWQIYQVGIGRLPIFCRKF